MYFIRPVGFDPLTGEIKWRAEKFRIFIDWIVNDVPEGHLMVLTKDHYKSKSNCKTCLMKAEHNGDLRKSHEYATESYKQRRQSVAAPLGTLYCTQVCTCM